MAWQAEVNDYEVKTHCYQLAHDREGLLYSTENFRLDVRGIQSTQAFETMVFACYRPTDVAFKA